MGTAVVAVETHSENGSAEGEEVEYGYPITCGASRAVLLFKKFVCPGINVKCVKYNDQLISPKQFVHLAGKATLKDWKRAIRLGGVMLRKMMDSGQIDFYQHDTVCTNTCRSTKFDLLISNTRYPPQSATLPGPPYLQGNGGQVAIVEDQFEETVAMATEWSPSMATAIAAATDAKIKKETADISEETLSFWKGIADVGLMGEVVSNIRTELLALLRGIQLRSGLAALQEPDAAVLNSLAQMFGLLDSVKRALENRRSQTDQNQEAGLHGTLTSLERQLEEQKKQACDWPQRSQDLPSMLLVSLGGSSKPPAHKRPRLTSSSSSSSSLFAVLSPITQSPALFARAATHLGQLGAPGSPEGEGQAHATVIEIDPAPGDQTGGAVREEEEEEEHREHVEIVVFEEECEEHQAK